MCIVQIIEVLADVAAVLGAIISVGVFKHSVKKERQILTLEIYSKIREKHSLEIFEMSEEEKLNYLKDLEYFCVGVNSGIYDFKALQKMSGKRLYSQYVNELKDYVNLRREKRDAKEIWCEYEKVMQQLECHYCSKKNAFQKYFCKKRG